MDLKIRNCPNNLHTKFKMLCVISECSMNTALIQLIEKYVNESWDTLSESTKCYEGIKG